MRGSNAACLTIALVCGFVAGLANSAHAQVVAFEGARLILGDGRTVESGTLVIDGNKITQAGAGVVVPAGATRVNAAGKTIMPAIIDTHVHLSPTRERLIRDLKMRAYYGISAALSMGLDNLQLMSMRQENIPGAARFFSAGRGITMPEPGRITVPHWITTPEEGRKAVQDAAANKVDIVKIWVDTRDNQFKKLTPDLYAPIIEEAHKLGLRVTAHIFDMEDAKGLMRANLDSFAHGVRDKDIDDETVAMFKARPQLFLIPNMPERGVKVDISWIKDGVPADEYEKLEKANVDSPKAQAFYGIQARNLKRLSDAGVKITMGTDGNRAWGPHEEMEDMVVAGMTPMQVIVSSTKNGAEFLRMTDAGTLEAGKSADFIVLDANPLDDIKNTRKISSVYLRGAVVDRSQPVR